MDRRTRERGLGLAIVVASVAGVAFIIFGDVILTTAGILLVILSAVAAATIYDRGLGEGEEPAPPVAFKTDYDEDADELHVTHQGGEKLDMGQVEIRSRGGDGVTEHSVPSVLSTGDAVELTDVDPGEEVLFVWTSPRDHKSKRVIYRWPRG